MTVIVVKAGVVTALPDLHRPQSSRVLDSLLSRYVVYYYHYHYCYYCYYLRPFPQFKCLLLSFIYAMIFPERFYISQCGYVKKFAT